MPFSVVLGVAISSYAKYCYRKLTKAALTGAKKVGGFVSVCPHALLTAQIKLQQKKIQFCFYSFLYTSGLKKPINPHLRYI